MSKTTAASETNQPNGTGAIPKAGQIKNRNSGKDKKSSQDLEMRGSRSLQSGAAELDFRELNRTATKSILKGAESAGVAPGDGRCKKRNKSVGFVLEGGEAVAPKKTKTEDIPVSRKHESRIFRNSRMKKHKKNRVFKDHPVDETMESTPATSATPVVTNKLKRKAEKTKAKVVQDEDMENNGDDAINDGKIQTKQDILSSIDDANNNRLQKLKKRKCQKKPIKMETEEEPTNKIRKESTSEDEMTEELENMHIGSNQSSLVDLLDDMVPSGPKPFKPKRDRHTCPKSNGNTDANSNEFDLKKVVKWTKKRWNKDRKGAASESMLSSQVVIQNLPAAMTSVYRKKLMDVFEKFGHIKRIGPAEVQPSNDGEALFRSTIYFENDEAATKALEEDNTRFGGSVIRVRRPLPPTETTCVARSYAHLPAYMEELREIFGGAGTLRGIRATPRRGSGMALAFLEFDGPEAVQRALALSETARINRKKVYVNRYGIRKNKKESHQKKQTPLCKTNFISKSL